MKLLPTPVMGGKVTYPDTAKLTGPRIFADKRCVGPVNLLYIIMSAKSGQNLLGPVKAQKFSRCLHISGYGKFLEFIYMWKFHVFRHHICLWTNRHREDLYYGGGAHSPGVERHHSKLLCSCLWGYCQSWRGYQVRLQQAVCYTLRLKQNERDFADISTWFLEWKLLYFNSYFSEICSQGFS